MIYNPKIWYSALLITIIHSCWAVARVLMMYCLRICLLPSNPPTKRDQEDIKSHTDVLPLLVQQDQEEL
jgi:hypothetical protein